MNTSFSNIPLDVTNKFHVAFTYSLLLDKYRLPNVIINRSDIPLLNDHINTLRAFPFHCFYLMKFGNIYFGEQFIDKGFKYGIYFKQSRVKRIIRKYKDLNLVNRPFGITPFNLMIEMHPELTTIIAEINPLNTLSVRGAKDFGFKEKCIVLEYNKNKNTDYNIN